MLMIRLQRVGRKNDPWFRVVVTEKASGPRNKYVERVGSFDIRRGNAVFKKERVLHWISKGSKPSSTVYNLLVSQGILEGKKLPKHTGGAVQKSAGEPVAQAAIPQEAVAEDVMGSPEHSRGAEEAVPQEEESAKS